MDERILALVILAALSLGAWGGSKLYRAQVMRRAQLRDVLDWPLDGRPTILGFTAEYCLPCRTQQHPALERLRAQLGDSLRIEEVDALERSDLAQRYGVLTVPTTVVLDSAHNLVAINYGVTSTEKLAKQVEPLLS